MAACGWQMDVIFVWFWCHFIVQTNTRGLRSSNTENFVKNREWWKQIIASLHARDMRTLYCPPLLTVFTSAVLVCPVQYVSTWLHLPTTAPMSAMCKNRHARRTACHFERQKNVLTVRCELNRQIKFMLILFLHNVPLLRGGGGGGSCRTFTVSIPGQSWDLWWTKWHWDSPFATSTSVSHCKCHSTKAKYVYRLLLVEGRRSEMW